MTAFKEMFDNHWEWIAMDRDGTYVVFSHEPKIDTDLGIYVPIDNNYALIPDFIFRDNMLGEDWTKTLTKLNYTI